MPSGRLHDDAEPQLARSARDATAASPAREAAPTTASPKTTAEAVLLLQRQHGNRAVARLARARLLARDETTTTDDPATQQLQDSELTLTGTRIALTDELLAHISGDGDSSQPPLLKKHRKDSTYQKVEGTAFGGGTPSPADVTQGGVGDCYLLAAMAAVARANPSVIEHMIKDNGDGTFDVTLYKDTAWFGTKLEKRVVKVTNTFPVDKNGVPIYAKKATGLDGKVALWVMLIEKAYAQREGGYDEIEGGEAGDALQVLTGQKKTQHELDDFSELQIRSTLDTLVANSYAITASPRRTGDDSDLAKEQDAVGIIRKHAYTVLRYDKDVDKIILRNPWGYQDPQPLSPAQFKKYYRWFVSVPTKT
jgi:hypothetical protein